MNTDQHHTTHHTLTVSTPGTDAVDFTAVARVLADAAGLVRTRGELGEHSTGDKRPRIRAAIARAADLAGITADALSKVHVGGRLDEGVIKWSRDTERRALELVTAQSRDAVEHYLNTDYVKAKVTEIEAKAGRPVTDAAKTVELVSKTLSFTPEQQTTILDHFIRGGQLTAGGVMQAVTSAAQTIADADVAHGMEAAGLRALEIAANTR